MPRAWQPRKVRKNPITFHEKVMARFDRKTRDMCWIWEGGLYNGRPAVNMRHVGRYIFEQERGPIPPGHTLWWTDHDETCKKGTPCRHMLCVNPYHVQLMERSLGLHDREDTWDVDDLAKVRGYKQRNRAKGQRNAVEGNQKDQRLDGDLEGTA